MEFNYLKLHRSGSIWTIELNRPEVFNALNPGLIHEIREVAEAAQISDLVRVLVITGSGKAFCSGADLKAGLTDPDLGNVLRATYNPMILALRGLNKPVIGAINGVAAGAGCSLALACDYLIAKEGAYFSELFIQIGLAMDAGSTAFLMQSVGYHKAFELASTGKRVSALEAKEIGFVAEVISEDEWQGRVDALAKEFSERPTLAIGLMKQALQKAQNQDLTNVLESEAKAQSVAGRSADFSEGVMSFMQKRTPKFTGK
jgi:2-(1,2-epoxy-1,2-dihydrophenyl)acetyl-CoA isomerase